MMLVFHSIYLFSTGSLLLITFLLISKPKKANRKANFWLSLFLFCLFLIFLEESIKILSLPDGDLMIYSFVLHF